MQLGPAQPRLPTKRPRDENFPVASLVLSHAHREAVLAFYGFVRAADDVADSRSLSPDEKAERLEALEQALISGDERISVAARLHRANAAHNAGIEEALRLLSAFRQDVTKTRYADWQELVDYCDRSANPVGRFLLRLHGEGEAAIAPADALCTALQILNHLQDLRSDREALDRIYLPVRWMDPSDEPRFFEPSNERARRNVLDAVLDRADALIDMARILPLRVASRRLRIQCAMTIELADRLSARLRVKDPVRTRVEVSRIDAAAAFLRACGGSREWSDARVTARMVRRSRSSFRLGMRRLCAERRRAIHAVYAFCRAVDDIADGAAPPDEKRRFLTEWRQEVDRLTKGPETPIGRELAWATQAFDLPLEECHALLDGMEADSAERVRLIDDSDLDTYGRRVAGSVGALSVRIFGAPRAHAFALDLGHTLQLVNILRDVDEDAALDRVYIPLSRLALFGLQDAAAPVLVRDPRFAKACQLLAAEARAGFGRADCALEQLDRTALKPAILMMEGYRRILDRLEERGWGSRRGRLHLTATDRLQLLTLAMRIA